MIGRPECLREPGPKDESKCKNFEFVMNFGFKKRMRMSSSKTSLKSEHSLYHYRIIENVLVYFTRINTSFSLPLSDLCCLSQRSYHVTVHLCKQTHIFAMNPDYPKGKQKYIELTKHSRVQYCSIF